MAARYPGHHTSRSIRSGSRASDRSRQPAPAPTPPPDDYVKTFDPCAATASYFLYAQRNVILSLHHDTLTVDRRFDKHKEEVLLIAADNVSERGAGRLIASYDAAQTAISWDAFTGQEVARFVSYETIKVAEWMRDGSIAFGNSQGAIILFDVETSEHINTRTIFDPITALAPASDCRTFAIGYQNGSILIASLQPSFTILHTLTTARSPTPINSLAWHGSSSKQKTDMLATQNADGCVRVWSVAKMAHNEQPRVIRNLDSTEMGTTNQNWLAWSKNGRLINFADGEAKAWDVRTKRVTDTAIPLVPNVVAISNYGPNGNLFTVSQNHGVQQYDLVASNGPTLVKQVFHVPPNAPPTPPGSTEIDKPPRVVQVKQPRNLSVASSIPIQIDTDTSGVDTSEDEGPILSPLQRIVKEMDDFEDERRDQLAPLSPVSSRASMSSASSYGRSRKHRPRNQSTHSRGSAGSGGTRFSIDSSDNSESDSMSIRSGTSMAPSIRSKAVTGQASKVRQKTMRSPEESKQSKFMDLFPYTKARLSDVKFRAPRYDQETYAPDELRLEMLKTVFGWSDDIESLIKDERARHKPGSASAVLLSKWLGETGADAMAQMVGSESMSSSDWMLLALTGSMGQGHSKQLGEAFVHRLLETDEVHPAVAILLGLGELNEAVEVYVGREYWLEATLLACLCFPHDWSRISQLVRKWGEVSVGQSQPELAVRCFSCTSIEASEAWFSPRSQDLTYQASRQIMAVDDNPLSPVSPPSAGSNRMTQKNAALKLVTQFGPKGEPRMAPLFGETPIAESAQMTPGGRRPGSRGFRDESATRTATPGGYKSNRMPSSSRNSDTDSYAPRRRATPGPVDTPGTAVTAVDLRRGGPDSMTGSRASSRDRNIHGLSINTGPVVGSRRSTATSVASGDTAMNSVISRGRHKRTNSSYDKLHTRDQDTSGAEDEAISPAMLTGDSMQSYKGRSIDRYISSLEQSHSHAQQLRSESKSRGEDRDARSKSRPRHREQSTARSDFSINTRGKRSPSSPKSFTTEEARPRRKDTPAIDLEGRSGMHSRKGTSTNDVESLITKARRTNTPADDFQPVSARPRASSKMSATRERSISPEARSGYHEFTSKPMSRNVSRGPSRGYRQDDIPQAEELQSTTYRRQSPTTPPAIEPMSAVRSRRERSTSRQPTPESTLHTASSGTRNPTPFDSGDVRARSSSRRPRERHLDLEPESMIDEDAAGRHGRSLSRKELAAKELEERRLSLARRPSAPPIPEPSPYGRPGLSPRSMTDGQLLSSKSFASDYQPTRSQTVDPDSSMRDYAMRQTAPSGAIGLPATPKAMRNVQHDFAMNDIPAVPSIPQDLATLSPVSYQPSNDPSKGPLLSSSVYGQRPPMTRSASTPPEKMLPMGGTASPKRISPTNPIFRRDRRDSNASQRSNRLQMSHQSSRHDSGDYSHNIYPEHNLDQIVIVPETQSIYEPNPPVLAELAHLSGPPPPPPPPPLFSQRSVQHSRENSMGSLSQYFPPNDSVQDHGMPSLSNSTLASRRTNSVSNTTDPASAISGSSSTSRWGRVADRVRASSRSRNATKTPGSDPYDTLLPNTYTRTRTPAPAPYETAYDSPEKKQQPEQGHTQRSASVGSGSVMRDPRDVRANMPPAQLQWGVDQ